MYNANNICCPPRIGTSMIGTAPWPFDGGGAVLPGYDVGGVARQAAAWIDDWVRFDVEGVAGLNAGASMLLGLLPNEGQFPAYRDYVNREIGVQVAAFLDAADRGETSTDRIIGLLIAAGNGMGAAMGAIIGTMDALIARGGATPAELQQVRDYAAGWQGYAAGAMSDAGDFRQSLAQLNGALRQVLGNIQNLYIAIRASYEAEIKRLQEYIQRLEALIADLIRENKALRQQIIDLQKRSSFLGLELPKIELPELPDFSGIEKFGRYVLYGLGAIVAIQALGLAKKVAPRR